MPDKSLRRRLPATAARRTRPPPSCHPRPTLPAPKQCSSSKPVKILERCLSEPMMGRSKGADQDDLKKQQQRSLLPEDDVSGGAGGGDGVWYRPLTCGDHHHHAFASSPSLTIPSSAPVSPFYQGYKKDAKVVVNVTVEGSPGPLRTMVKLGSSVEDTIKFIVEKYGEEGRTPKLDKEAASTYELHHSHFSLQSIDKSELIGDVGSRSFYLRRSSSNRSVNGSSSFTEAVPVNRANSPPPGPPPTFLLPAIIARKLGKIERRARRLWKVLFCSQ
ncbi:hypothetical protein Tsubulata_029138 [Turnera subulata]|uniref:DUF7054 domain-containing protein n=1 Tax=Turnera subulata TaxID=218843 RepID=A0A9Q0J4F9_9ROSI|nr:hypothetical protein Tsubulata_029138 [Turnera subulata]